MYAIRSYYALHQLLLEELRLPAQAQHQLLFTGMSVGKGVISGTTERARLAGTQLGTIMLQSLLILSLLQLPLLQPDLVMQFLQLGLQHQLQCLGLLTAGLKFPSLLPLIALLRKQFQGLLGEIAQMAAQGHPLLCLLPLLLQARHALCTHHLFQTLQATTKLVLLLLPLFPERMSFSLLLGQPRQGLLQLLPLLGERTCQSTVLSQLAQSTGQGVPLWGQARQGSVLLQPLLPLSQHLPSLLLPGLRLLQSRLSLGQLCRLGLPLGLQCLLLAGPFGQLLIQLASPMQLGLQLLPTRLQTAQLGFEGLLCLVTSQLFAGHLGQPLA